MAREGQAWEIVVIEAGGAGLRDLATFTRTGVWMERCPQQGADTWGGGGIYPGMCFMRGKNYFSK